MTLILVIAPTKNALVVAADKRLIDDAIDDTFTKIRRIQPDACGAACGRPRALDSKTRDPQFDAFSRIDDFFAAKPLSTGTAREFARVVENSYDEFIDTYHALNPMYAVGYRFTIVLAQLTKDGPTLYTLPFFRDPGAPTRLRTGAKSPEFGLDDPRVALISHSGLHAFGDEKVCATLLEQKTPRLEAIHEHGNMRKRLTRHSECEFGSICIQQAVDLCVQVIEIASAHAEAITGEPSTISPDCDVALIDDAGFHWKHGSNVAAKS